MDDILPPSANRPDDEARHAHPRSWPRDSMFLAAVIRRIGGPDVPITVRNLSRGGMMADCTVGFPRGEAVEVDLRGIGTVTGRVAWATGGKIGVAFDQEIDPKNARKPVTGNPQPQLVRASTTSWRPGLR